jgi:outer membrane receptor protein involved in Fe transport
MRTAHANTIVFVAMLTTAIPIARAAQTTVTADSTGGTDRHVLSEVLVTAEKRTESVQNVPAAVSVVGGAELENLQAVQLTDYASYVSGLQVDSGGTPGQTQITLRGIDANGGGATVGTYIDDSPLGSSSLFAQGASYQLDLMPYDIERVEVLKGPQGTLYGASTMGGLVKYVLRAPDLKDFEARAGVDLFDIDGAGTLGRGVRATVNLPVIEDKLAIRASYSNRLTPGYIDDGATGAKNQNTDREQAGRLSVLWQIASKLSLKLTAMAQSVNADSASVETVSVIPLRYVAGAPVGFSPGAPVDGDLTDSHVPTLRYRQRMQFFSATLDWDLGWASLTSATSYSQALNDINFDLTPGFGGAIPDVTDGAVPAGLTPFYTRLDLYKTTEEVRLASPGGGPIEWLFGLFYTDEYAPQIQTLHATDLAQVVIPAIDPLAQFASPSKYSETSAFGDITFKLPWESDVTAGLRLARDHQEASSAQTGVLIPVSDNGDSASEDVHTYMFALRHHFAADSMLYARVASGFRPGGPNTPFPGVPPRVNPDKLVNYELGLKSSLADRRVQLDLAAFAIRWSDVQVEATTPGGVQYETNGGSAKSDGVELEGVFTPVPRLTLRLNGAYTDPVLTSDIPSLGYLAGDRLALTPKWSGSLVAEYFVTLTANLNATLNAAYRYVGERYSLVSSDPNAIRLPSYGALDASVGISNSRWAGRLFVRNATNKRGYLSETILSYPGSGAADLAILQPRTVGVSFDIYL